MKITVFINITDLKDASILQGINEGTKQNDHDGIYIDCTKTKQGESVELNKNEPHLCLNSRIFIVKNVEPNEELIARFGRVNKSKSFIVKENKTDYEVTI